MYPATPNHPAKRLRQMETKSLTKYLEQHQHNLDDLRFKLNGYATRPKKEPITVEQIASLKSSIEAIGFDNLTILARLKELKKSRGDSFERMTKQFSEFHKLRRVVKEYVHGIETSRQAKQTPMSESVQFLGNFHSESSRIWSQFSTSMHAFFF